MNKRTTIELSEAARLHAEERMAEEGFESIDAYVDALIFDDHSIDLRQDWLRKKIEEGLASPDAGELTPERIRELVAKGIARANRTK